MNHLFSGKELRLGVVRVWQSYRPESLSFIVGRARHGRSKPVEHPPNTELPWSHHMLFGNQIYFNGRGQSDVDAVDCGKKILGSQKGEELRSGNFQVLQ